MSEVEPAAQFPLRQSAFLGLWAWVGLGLAFLVFLDPSFRAEATEDLVLWIGVAVVVALLPMLWMMFLRQRSPQILEVSRDRLRVPVSMAVLEIPLNEIEALVFEEGRRAGLFLSTERFDTFIPASRFASGDAARAAYSAIRARIEALPPGSTRLKTMEPSEVEVAPRAFVTEILLALIVVAFALEKLSGALSPLLSSDLALLSLGANSRILLARGEVWRLLSSAFLHANILHLALNGFGLWTLGAMCERMFGRANYLAIYLLSAIGGALGSAAIEDSVISIGASTSLFGLVGAMLYAQIRHRDTLPLRYRIPESSWYTLFALNLLLPILFPVIDWVAHVVGAVTGALVAMLLISDADRLPLPSSGRPGRIAAALLSLCTVASIGFAVHTALHWDPFKDESYLTALITQNRLPPLLNNNIAWTLAKSPDTPRPLLELADRAIQRAVDEASEPTVVDTQAQVAYRLGRFEDAVRLEASVLNDAKLEAQLDPETKKSANFGMATRMMSFLAANYDRRGRLVDDKAPAGLTLSLQDGRLATRTVVRIERPTAVYVLARQNKDILGMAVVQLMPTPPMIDPPIVATSPLELPWAETASITIAYVTRGEVKQKAYVPEPDATR
ncbi:MAG: rhomboid family intramembrane serine protease [Myxococcota bacterium]